MVKFCLLDMAWLLPLHITAAVITSTHKIKPIKISAWMGVNIWEWATAVKGLMVLLFRRKWETLNSGLELNGMLSRSLKDSSNESYVDWRLPFKRSQGRTILTTRLENVSVIFGGGG